MKTGGYPCEHGYYGICAQCVREERDELRARVAELEARIAELELLAECAAIMAVCGYFSRMRGPDCYKVFTEDGDYVYVDDGVPCCYPDPNITPLYAGSAPVPAVLQAVDVDVDAICNAYESGVGHRGRPTANVNPYREGTPEHEAYAIGAKGEAAQQAKVPDDNSYAEFIVVDANENTTEATASGPRKRSLSEAMHYARQYAEDGEIVVYELVEVARMDYSVSAQSAQEGKV